MDEKYVDETMEPGADEQRLAATQNKNNQNRNVANNVNNVRAAADIASKTNNPYAKAIGGAVKAADKLSGGKASEKLGKALNTANKLSPGGRMLQKGLNKMSESGTTDRIQKAVNKKNSIPKNTQLAGSGGATVQGKDTSFFSTKEVEEETSDGGGSSFQLTVKFMKTALIAMVPIMVVVVFLNLLTSGSLAVRNIIGIGNADTTPNSKMEEDLEKAKQSELEDKDESNLNDASPEAFDYDLFISDEVSNFRNSKLKKINNEVESSVRNYNEADITELEDYYPDIANYQGDNYKQNVVYKFFFKMHYLYFYYNNKYNVQLDIPLLMATLSINSNDMEAVFESNVINYTDSEVNDLKETNDRFDYHKTISYESTPESAEWDMEILAQNMVSVVPYVAEEETCKETDVIDGMCYVVDYDKYNEFLKEYLEKKYYEGGTLTSTGDKGPITSNNTCSSTTQFTKYNLTDDQVAQIASLAYHEQGTAKGAAAEASLMANLFEIKGSKYGSGASGLYNYIRNSGWFANAANYMDSRDASAEIIAAVKSVLVDGKRTLPGYIDEHDYIGDISSATTNGKNISVGDRVSYTKFNTKLTNIYGATYTFYSYPDTYSDPFGYTSEKIRSEKGEFYYDFDTGEPVNCTDSTISNEYAEAMIALANKELEENKGKGGDKYNSYFKFPSGTAWCANFASYLISNTSVNGVSIYPNIIDFITASTGTFISNFNNSQKTNINFYYNDNCSKLKGKNGEDTTYTPKPGDLIFIDWGADYTDISSNTQDHTGIVEKYEDGKIYTIEGNSGNPGRIKKQSYSISDCRVIGFGSWY